LWLGVLSTLLPYGIGVLSAKGLGGSEAYQSLVYTFLHLQYNGWFLFVVLGLFFKLLENNHIYYHQKYAVRFYWLFTLAVMPAIALSMVGMSFSKYILLPAYVAATLQSIALLYFLRLITGNLITAFKEKSKWFQLYVTVFLVSFIIKVALQCFSVLPVFKLYAFYNKYIILAYLHLSLIGVISFLLLALMIDLKWLSTYGFCKIGSSLLVLGFAITELLLVFGGLGWYYSQVMLITGSATMVMGILFLIVSSNNKIVRSRKV